MRKFFIAGIAIVGSMAFLIYQEILTSSDALNISILAILVLVTTWYARETANIAKATKQQADTQEDTVEEMRRQVEIQSKTLEELKKERDLRYAPLVIITQVRRSPLGRSNVPESVMLRNFGYGVALEVHCKLEEGGSKLLEGRCPGLLPGEEQLVYLDTLRSSLGGIGSKAEFTTQYYSNNVKGTTYFTKSRFCEDNETTPFEIGKVDQPE